ncbi:hypothetical protein AYK26_06480 [Euryarchaeota archaeon SM23-78]|nr:MAG: hypothetical protein AYK26_06480 [Euryarchaeota archaeon SM23-78]
MSLMDKVREYNRLKEKKAHLNKLDIKSKDFSAKEKQVCLDNLDKELKELEKESFDYKLLAEKVIKEVEKRSGLSSLVCEEQSDSKDFKVGDRVVGINNTCTVGNNNVPIKGLKGQIINPIGLFGGVVGVDFDKCIDGHDCDGDAKDGYGWWVPKSYLKKLVNTKLSTDIKTQKEFKAFTNDLVERVVKASKERKDGIFKIGDKVIPKISLFISQRDKRCGDIATITEIIPPSDYKLTFEDGYSNYYDRWSLKLVTAKDLQRDKAEKLVNDVISQFTEVPDIGDYMFKQAAAVKKTVTWLQKLGYNEDEIGDFLQKKSLDVLGVTSDNIRKILNPKPKKEEKTEQYERTPFVLGGHHRYGLRNWLDKNFPFLRHKSFGNLNESELDLLKERASEIMNACRVVEQIDIDGGSAYVDYYKEDRQKLREAYQKKSNG